MMYKVLSTVDKFNAFKVASAHCDIPCGIYDPSSAQIATLSVIRALNLIQELQELSEKGKLSLQQHAKLVRLVDMKEVHAEQVKNEIRIIWGDYFKKPQCDEYPQIHVLVHSILQIGSKCRQDTEQENGLELLNLVNQFAEIFWATKGKKTARVKCPYPPELLVVYPVLSQ